MEKIVLEDGTEREVLSADEVKALNEKAALADKTAEDLKKLEEAKKELESQVNPNWQEARKKMKTMEDKLKEKGVQVNPDGTVIEAKKELTHEDIINTATEAASKTFLENQRSALLSKYDTETRKVIDHYYNKLTAGEKVDATTLEKFVTDAVRMAVPEERNPGYRSASGRVPVFKAESQVTEGQKDIANSLGIPAKELEKGGNVSV